MISLLTKAKQNFKQALIEHQHSLYQKEVLEKRQTYDSWIRQKEEQVIRDRIKGMYHLNYLTNDTAKGKKDLDKKRNDVEPAKKWNFIQIQVENCRNMEKNNFLILPYEVLTRNELNKIEKINADIILFHQAGTELSELAVPLLTEYFMTHPEASAAYGDEDWMAVGGTRKNPWFKPDWSPDTFLDSFYLGGIFAVRASVYEAYAAQEDTLQQGRACSVWEAASGLVAYAAAKSGGLRKRTPGHILSDFPVGHISEILLHHREQFQEEQFQEEQETLGQACRAGKIKNDQISRIFEEGDQKTERKTVRVISIIIPSKDNPKVLETCLQSLLHRTTLPAFLSYEILLVDNGSCAENRQWITALSEKLNQEVHPGFRGCRYLYKQQEFNFSTMCKQGAAAAQGELLLFLNDDMEIIQADWLRLLYEKAILPHAGAVGAKLLYPDSNKIQHAGITNLRVGPAHKLQFLADDQSYYFGRNRGVHDMAAVTGACLLVRKEVYEEVGGFSEELAVAFNDVDLCYRILEAGYYNIERNDVILYHHESLSRGKDGESPGKQRRLLREKDLLYRKHQQIYGKDPFYHKYLTTDMLETRYTPACQYEVTLQMPWAKLQKDTGRLQDVPQDNCVVIGMECAMDLYKWIYGVEETVGEVKMQPEERGYYFQGYTFLIGADNACYQKTLLLQNLKNGEIWRIPVDGRYREDIRNNLSDQLNVDLTGYAAKVSKEDLPAGTYRFGMLYEDRCSRQKLLNWSNWELER